MVYSQHWSQMKLDHRPLDVYDADPLLCVYVFVMCSGGTSSAGCGGVLQLPAFRLTYCLHHHTLSYCQCQGILWILLEGEGAHTHTHSSFIWRLRGKREKLETASCDCLLFSLAVLLFALQLMRKVLGTHLGHSAIYTMCRIMEERYCPFFRQLEHLSKCDIYYWTYIWVKYVMGYESFLHYLHLPPGCTWRMHHCWGELYSLLGWRCGVHTDSLPSKTRRHLFCHLSTR